MRKVGKIIAFSAIALLLIVAGGAILAKLLLTPERIRAAVVPLAQEHLGREVSLEGIEFSIFSGIVLEGLEIKEANGEDTFVSAERALLRYRLWPLLKLQLEVDEIALIKPHIRVVRHADSSFNFSDLLQAQNDTKPPAPPADTETSAAQAGAAAAAISIHIANLTLEDGTLQVVDHAVAAPRSHQYELSNFNLNARAIALRQTFPLKISCSINGAALEGKGQVNLLKRTLEAEAALTRFDVEAFAPYFVSAIPGELHSLALSAQLKVSATPAEISSRGEISLEDIGLTLAAMPDAPIKDATFLLNYAGTYQTAQGGVQLDRAELNYNGIKAELQGKIGSINSTPTLNLDFSTPAIYVATLLQALPPQLIAAQDMNPAGSLRLQGQLHGEVSTGAALLQRAEVELAGVEADVEGMRPRLNGTFILAGERMQSEDLTLKLGSNVAQMEMVAKDIYASPLALTHNIDAERFDLDAILATAAAPAAAADQSTSGGGTAASAQEIGPLDIPLRLDGSINIGEALYQGLSITNFSMRYRLRDNVLDIDTLSGSTCGGTVTSSANIDLRRQGLEYRGETRVEGVQADPLISALAPESANTVFGALNLNASYRGHGTLPETLKRQLIAKVELNMDQARISSTRLTNAIANFLSLEQLRDIRFDTFVASADIANGSAQVKGDFSGTNVRAYPQGRVGLGGDLNLGLNARLAPRLAQELDRKGHVAGLLTNDEGWALLPLKITGNYAEPRITLDESALSEQATRKAVENLTRRLLDKIAPESEPSAEGEAPEAKTQPDKEDPTRKLIDDAFKSIFGN
ncbi:MAG: AsmA family protein [Geobacteraceae bacterium]|nr:AsmA family protein [Geobacteraceae bacterium]